MSRAFSKPRWRRGWRPGWRLGSWRLGRAGATSLEFALVALLFLTVLIGCMDIGRYFLVVLSLRTVVSEAARAALVNPNMLPTPVLGPGSFSAITPIFNNNNLALTVTQSPGLPGVQQISVTATYSFTAWSPIWSASLDGPITETTELQY